LPRSVGFRTRTVGFLFVAGVGDSPPGAASGLGTRLGTLAALLGLDARGSSPAPPASHLATWIHRTVRPDEAHRDPLYRRGCVPMAPHGAVSAC